MADPYISRHTTHVHLLNTTQSFDYIILQAENEHYSNRSSPPPRMPPGTYTRTSTRAHTHANTHI